MKTTILLSSFVLFITSMLQAQIDKGRTQIGGSLSLNHYEYTNSALNVLGKSMYIGVSTSTGVF